MNIIDNTSKVLKEVSYTEMLIDSLMATISAIGKGARRKVSKGIANRNAGNKGIEVVLFELLLWERKDTSNGGFAVVVVF